MVVSNVSLSVFCDSVILVLRELIAHLNKEMCLHGNTHCCHLNTVLFIDQVQQAAGMNGLSKSLIISSGKNSIDLHRGEWSTRGFILF